MRPLRDMAGAAPVQTLRLPELDRAGIELAVWRLDLIDTAAPGNKLFKLRENLRAARAAGHTRLLSFGGAFSNHIHALAQSGAQAGFETVGVIRGEPAAADNPTLKDARLAGMMLHFVDRQWYRRRDSAEALAELQARFGPCHIIPEGGANRLGTLGCRALGETLRAWPPTLCAGPHAACDWTEPPDIVALPCATGSTLAGLAAGLEGCCEVLGVAVLKGGQFLDDAVRGQLRAIGEDGVARWRIDTRHHGGGYAKVSLPLARFLEDFQRRTRVPLEPVYSGKLLHALWRGIEAGEFARGTRLLAVHSGGLQGARGFGWRALSGCGEAPRSEAFSVTGFMV